MYWPWYNYRVGDIRTWKRKQKPIDAKSCDNLRWPRIDKQELLTTIPDKHDNHTDRDVVNFSEGSLPLYRFYLIMQTNLHNHTMF